MITNLEKGLERSKNDEEVQDVFYSQEDLIRELELDSGYDCSRVGFSKSVPFSQAPPFFQAPRRVEHYK